MSIAGLTRAICEAVRRLSAILLLCGMTLAAHAEVCPPSSDGLRAVTVSVSSSHRGDRAPAGADCAYVHGSNYSFHSDTIGQEEIDFFTAAGDVHRRASEMRRGTTDEEKYLNHEIELRRKFLDKALKEPLGAPIDSSPNRTQIVRHLSALVSAMAKRNQYEQLADYLTDQPPTFIDEEALNVWLQAVWSCAKWDGKLTNVCAEENRERCRDKVALFIESVDAMKGRSLKRQAQLDLTRLKKLTSPGQCLQ